MGDWSVDLPVGPPRVSPTPAAPVPADAPVPIAAPAATAPTPGMAGDTVTLNRGPDTVQYAPDAYPPGRGLTLTAPGARVESDAHQTPGAGFEGRLSRESLQALQQAGGVSYAYTSPHNGNREVDVWASPGFDPTRPYEVLLYDRGIHGDNAGSLDHAHLAEMMRELNAQGRNVLLVLPKSPQNMDRWFAPPEDANAMLGEALGNFSAATGMQLGPPRETWLMAHSGGGKSVVNILDHPNPPHLDKVLLADSTYGNWAAEAADALQRHPGVQLATVVTDHNAGRAGAQLAARGAHVDHMPAHWQYEGHEGVPAYMLASFLGANPTLGFSHYDPARGWQTDAPGASLPPADGPAASTPLPPPAGPAAPGLPQPGARLLARGARGPEVQALQQRLRDLGFDPGPVDGIFGPRTQAAVEALQRRLGMNASGSVDDLTRAVLAE